MGSLLFTTICLFMHCLFLLRDSTPTKPSFYNMDSCSSPSAWKLGHSVETPDTLASPNAVDLDGWVPMSNSPLKLQESLSNTKCDDHLAQECIDELDLVCYLAITPLSKLRFSSDTEPHNMQSRTT